MSEEKQQQNNNSFKTRTVNTYRQLKDHLNSLPNPGGLELFNKEFRSLFPSHLFFDGGKLEISHHLTQLTHATHTFQAGSRTVPAAYQVGIAHYFSPPISSNISYIQALLDTTAWTLQGKYNHCWNNKWSSKLQTQIALQNWFGSRYNTAMLEDPLKFLRDPNAAPASPPAQSGIVLEQEYIGSNFTTSIKLANPSAVVLPVSGQVPVVFPCGILTASWLQSIRKNSALGYELTVQKMLPQISSPNQAIMGSPTLFSHSLVGRYVISPFSSPESEIITGTLTFHPDSDQLYASPSTSGCLQSVSAEYFKKIDDHLELGSEVQFLTKSKETVLALFGKMDFRAATLRARIDTAGKVSTILEEKLVPNVFTFSICAELDHATGHSRFGVGATFEA